MNIQFTNSDLLNSGLTMLVGGVMNALALLAMLLTWIGVVK